MDDEQTNQLAQQMQALETYFFDLSQREETFLNILREAAATIESIKSISQQPESDTLVPIGMGAFVSTKILSDKKIILNIGAGVAVEKDSASTINYLESRIKEVEIVLKDAVAKKQDAASMLEQGRARINEFMQKDMLQQQQQQQQQQRPQH